MILGSKIAPFAEDVWGCEFGEEMVSSGRVCIGQIAYLLDHTSKTRAIFEINKGSNKHPIDVNANIEFAERRVLFENMIYVADGPSDIPAFSIINRFHGRTYAVYPAGSMRDFKQSKKLLDDRRVQGFGEANYETGSPTYMWLLTSIEEIADRIVDIKKTALKSKVSAPPRHLT
jgi:hypothetical protein